MCRIERDLEPFGRDRGDADDEDDDQRHLDLKAQSVPPVQHRLMVVPHISLFNRNSRQDVYPGNKLSLILVEQSAISYVSSGTIQSG